MQFWYFFFACFNLQNIICFLSDNANENHTVRKKSSVAEAKTPRRGSRGIWSLAEMAASSSRNVPTVTTTALFNNSHF